MSEKPRYLNDHGWQIPYPITAEVVESDQPIGEIKRGERSRHLTSDLVHHQYGYMKKDGKLFGRARLPQNRMSPEGLEKRSLGTSSLQSNPWYRGLLRDPDKFVREAGGTLEPRDKTKLFPDSLSLKP